MNTMIRKLDATKKSSIRNLALKPLSMILGLVYTPLLLSYLGDTKYGLWSTILSIISWVNYCDIGIGHGLRNLLTKELAQEAYKKAQRTVSTAYIILTFIAFILLCICLGCTFLLNWNTIFNTSINMRYPLGISFVFICINFILSLSNFILYALQLSEAVSLRNVIIQSLNIIGLFLVSLVTSGSLVWVSLLFGSTTMIVYFWNTIIIIKRYPHLKPKIREFDKTKISEISNVGIKFFIIQLACLALYTVDNLLITNLFGADAVTPFNITYRIFNTAYAFLTAICVPYWSKTTDAIERKDIKWIRNALNSLYKIAFLFILGFVLLAILFKPLARLWLGRDLVYPSGIILVMCVYYCLYTIVTVHTQLINGTGEINFQLILMIFMGASNIPLSIFLAKNCGLGVIGIRLATTILMAIAAIAFPFNLHRILLRYERKFSSTE